MNRFATIKWHLPFYWQKNNENSENGDKKIQSGDYPKVYVNLQTDVR